ncbi:hypothetical protein COJ48_04120 [Bacillus cereus]|nr:hypothetical protein COJ48_04120 [Bacillus cereus]PGP84959.1 hypothetical protein CN997_10325 [Bacillus cereus]
MEKKYYVYTHELNGEIIYVGKGSGTRATYFSNRSTLWKNIVGDNIESLNINVVKYFDDENEAYTYEEKLTSYYKSVGQCKANLDIGRKHTEEFKRQQSEKLKGKNAPWYGKKLSNEHKKKMSLSRMKERNHLYGKTGKDHNCSKSTVAIFPNGEIIKTASRTELATIMEEKYDMRLSTVKKCIATGKPYQARYRRHKHLEGLVIKYIGA